MLFEIMSIALLSTQSLSFASKAAYEEPSFLDITTIASDIIEGKPIAVELFYDFCAPINLPTAEKIHIYSSFVEKKIETINEMNLSYDEIIGASAFPVVTLIYFDEPLENVTNDLSQNLSMQDLKSVLIRQSESYTYEGGDLLTWNDVDLRNQSQKEQPARDTYIDYRDIPYDGFENGTQYTGNGVTIGIADFGPFDKNHTNFADTNITMVDMAQKDSSIVTTLSHADCVMSILTGKYGIAPRADIVLVDANSSNYTGWRYLDLFASLNVDVVNLSLGTGGSGYDLHDYFDFFVYNYQIPVVCSAPNGLTGYLTQPNSAQNVISVCSIDANHIIANGAYLRDPANDGGVKKAFRIAATGDLRVVNIYGNLVSCGGTSMATPVVTGAIALMMEKNPALKNNVPMLMAALGNASSQSIVSSGTSGVSDTLNSSDGLKDWSGVGALDIKQSLWIAGWITTPSVSLTPYTESYLFSVNDVLAGQKLYLTHSWLKKVTYNGSSYSGYTLSDFDLLVCNSSNVTVVRTNGTLSNVERLTYTFTSSGNYTVKIKIYNSTLSYSLGQYGISCVRGV